MNRPEKIDYGWEDGVRYWSRLFTRWRFADDGSGMQLDGQSMFEPEPGEGELQAFGGNGYIDIRSATAHDLDYDGVDFIPDDGRLHHNRLRSTYELRATIYGYEDEIDHNPDEEVVVAEIPCAVTSDSV